MKSLYIKTLSYSMLILLFMSCKKDETKTVAGTGTAPAITATTNTLVLKMADSAAMATVFNWTASSFGYNAGISYTLQMDLAGNNFSKATEIALSNGLTRSFSVYELNSMMAIIGAKVDVPNQIEVRTMATISSNYAPAYSNVLPLTVTPFYVEVVYPALWIPGSYQAWTPDRAPKIVSVANDKSYEGYLYFPDANTEFKINIAPDWNHTNYGTSSSGTLNPTGGDNLKAAAAGYYLLKANTATLTYSITKTTFGVLGSATGSATTDTPMSYDPVTKVWKVTKALVAGDLKFRANGTDAISYGSNTPADGKLKLNGVNIPVTEAGTYEIIFNVSIPGNYRYTLTKQ